VLFRSKELNMGAGASTKHESDILKVVVNQKMKPLDVSDINDLESAKLEIKTMRGIIALIDVDRVYQKLPSSGSMRSPRASTVELSSSVDLQRGQAILSSLKDKMDQKSKAMYDVFLKIDTDRSGYLSKEEFQTTCQHWGVNLTNEDFDSISATYLHQENALQSDRGINYNEFINLMTRTLRYKPGEGEAPVSKVDVILRGKILNGFDTLKQAFKHVDKDSSGTVDKRELDLLLRSYDLAHSPQDLEDLFSVYDKNGDGVFSYGEFVKLMQAKSK